MNPMLVGMNNDRQKHYDDAKKDLLQAFYSFSRLDDEQKRQLMSELVGAETVFTVYSIMRQFFG